MPPEQNSYYGKSNDSSAFEDEIDLKQACLALVRNTKLILCCMAGGVLLSFYLGVTEKKFWRGEFQIVVNRQESGILSRLRSSEAGLSSILTGGGAKGVNLQTEMVILKSPSVLIPVYNYVKNINQELGLDTEGWRFISWVTNVDVETEKGTTVLNVSYKDVNKDFVLPILNKISEQYQNYSGQKRYKGLLLGFDYLEEQVSRYKEISYKSMKEVQQYAINKDLSPMEFIGVEKSRNPSIPTEASRIAAINKIRKINSKLKLFEELVDQEEIIAAAKIILKEKELASINLSKVSEVSQRLEYLREHYTVNDEDIIDLEDKKKVLISLIKVEVINLLKANLLEEEAIKESSQRSKEVLFKYKELLQKAARDEATLRNLKNELQALRLEKARREEPWELISEPVLFDKPLGSNLQVQLIYGLFGGLAIGSITALVYEKRKNILYNKKEIEATLGLPLLEIFSTNKLEGWHESAEFLANGALADITNGSIAVIPIGEIDNTYVKKLHEALKCVCESRKIVITRDLIKASKCSKKLLVISLGTTTGEVLIKFKKRLSIQNMEVAGWILLE